MNLIKELNKLFRDTAPLTREIILFVNETGGKTNDEPGLEMMPAWHNVKFFRRLIDIDKELFLSGNTFSLNPSDERYFYQSIIEKNALENIPDADKYDAQDISNLSKAIVEQTRMMSANFFNVPPQMIVDILPPAPDQPLLTEAFLRAEPGSTLDRNVKSGIAAALSVAVKKNPLLSSALAPSSIIGNAYIGVEGIKSAVIAGDFSQGLSEIDPQLSRPSPAL